MRRWALVVSLTAAVGATGRLYDSPDELTLWLEDFRSLELTSDPLAGAGWLTDGLPPRTEEAADGLRLAASPGRGATSRLTRELPLDLEGDQTPGQYPYLVLDLAQVEAGLWAGVSLADVDQRAPRPLLERGDRAGRYVLDLRAHLPRRVGRLGALPLALAVHGATEQAPGPLATLSALFLAAEAPDRIEIAGTGADGTIRRGDTVTVTVRLSAPAQAVRLELTCGTPRRAFSFDGTSSVDLQPADETGQVFRAILPVTAAGTSWRKPGAGVLVSAEITGGPLPRLLTTVPGDIDTTGAPPPRPAARLAVVDTAPVLDGRLDDDAWTRAEPVRGFQTADGGLASPATTLRAARTGDTLYLALTADEPRLDGLVAAQTERDAELETDDALRVTLAPRLAGTAYQFAVNSLGTVADRTLAEGERVNREWDTDWAAVVERGATGWTAEFAIPLAVLDLGGGADDTWGLNIERFRQAGGQAERSVWVRSPGIGLLEGPTLDTRPFGIELSEPRLEVTGGLGGLRAELRIDAVNRTDATLEVQALATVEGGGAPLQLEVSLPPGEQRLLSWPLIVPDQGRWEFVWRIFGPGQPRLLAAGRRRLEVRHLPLELRWAAPVEDGRLRLGSAAEVGVEVLTEPGLGDGAALIGTLLAGDRPVAEHRLTLEGRTARLSLPVAGLTPGTYQLDVRVQRGDELLARAGLSLVAEPAPAAARVTFEAGGLIAVDGELLLPVGWSGDAPPAEAAFAVRLGRLDPAAPPEDSLVIHNLSEVVLGAAEATGGRLGEATREQIRGLVAERRDSPALFGWLIADTPELLPTAPDYLRDVRELLAELDPAHPVLLLCRGQNGVQRYGQLVDVIIAATDAARLPALIQTAGDRPVWLELAVGTTTPTAAVACQAHLALALGARGVLLAGPEQPAPPQLAGLLAVREQLLGLTPFLVGEPLDLGVTPPAAIWGRRLAAATLVVLVNPTGEALEVAATGLPVEVLPPGPPPPDGRVVERLAPFEVRILQSRP